MRGTAAALALAHVAHEALDVRHYRLVLVVLVLDREMPTLAFIAQAVLSMTSSTTDLESAFSVVGNIVSERRSSLSNESINELIFIYINCDRMQPAAPAAAAAAPAAAPASAPAAAAAAAAAPAAAAAAPPPARTKTAILKEVIDQLLTRLLPL